MILCHILDRSNDRFSCSHVPCSSSQNNYRRKNQQQTTTTTTYLTNNKLKQTPFQNRPQTLIAGQMRWWCPPGCIKGEIWRKRRLEVEQSIVFFWAVTTGTTTWKLASFRCQIMFCYSVLCPSPTFRVYAKCVASSWKDLMSPASSKRHQPSLFNRKLPFFCQTSRSGQPFNYQFLDGPSSWRFLNLKLSYVIFHFSFETKTGSNYIQLDWTSFSSCGTTSRASHHRIGFWCPLRPRIEGPFADAWRKGRVTRQAGPVLTVVEGEDVDTTGAVSAK